MNNTLSKNQKILKMIKVALEGLPIGLGAQIGIPSARWCLRVVRNFRTRLISKNLALKIKVACENPDINEFVVCYDLLVSPLTLGDLMCCVMLARYAALHEKRTRFVFIEGEVKHDSAEVFSDKVLFNKNFGSMRLTATTLLDKSTSEVQSMSWNDFQKSIGTEFVKQGSTFIAMEEFVRHRVSIYNHTFNILNFLLSFKSISFVDKFLLDYDELSKLTGVFQPEYSYVTLGARYSLLWAKERNLEIETLKVICNYVFKKHPNHKVMIVSDEIGCDYFRENTRNMDFDLVFSKDYSSTYLGDGALILGSTFYFQFLGGGIGIIPMFSNIPYEITCPLVHESMWSTRRLMSWQSLTQIYNDSAKLDISKNQ